MTYNSLRLCAGCNAWLATFRPRRGDDPSWCQKCWGKLMEKSADPQPGDRVVDIDRPTGPFSALVVIARDGDTITAQPIGEPGWRQTLTVGGVIVKQKAAKKAA